MPVPVEKPGMVKCVYNPSIEGAETGRSPRNRGDPAYPDRKPRERLSPQTRWTAPEKWHMHVHCTRVHLHSHTHENDVLCLLHCCVLMGVPQCPGCSSSWPTSHGPDISNILGSPAEPKLHLRSFPLPQREIPHPFYSGIHHDSQDRTTWLTLPSSISYLGWDAVLVLELHYISYNLSLFFKSWDSPGCTGI